MDVRAVLDTLRSVDPQVALLVGVPVALLVLALVVRRIRRAGKSARTLTGLATVVGLAWSAQGMWDTAVHTYKVVPSLAAVLFFLFEAMIVSRMLRAEEYRDDRPRRARFVRSVWLIASAMGVIVALGEGAQQAPLRLAVPLGVAYIWWLDLTADDDPEDHGVTSLRWTPRRLALAIGMIEPGARDAVTVDRDRLTDRMTMLAFRHKHSPEWIDALLRREERLARLALAADDAIVREMHARLLRSESVLVSPSPEKTAPTEAEPVPQLAPEVHPVIPPQPRPPVRVTPVRIDPEEPAKGWRRNPDGILLRGRDLRDDVIRRFIPGMSNADLASLYTPPLGDRTAEDIGAEARRQRVNGSAVQ